MADENGNGHPCPPDADCQVRELLNALFDAQARQMIAEAYHKGLIRAEDLVDLLIELDLIEVPHGR